MSEQHIREVQAPYTIRLDDQAVGRETIIIHQKGKPVAAIVPYPLYEKAILGKTTSPTLPTPDPEFEKQWNAFQRMKPDLLQKYPGQWVAVVNEQIAAVGPDFSSVAEKVEQEFGNVPRCIGEVLETPKIYRMTTRRVIRRAS